MKNGATALNLPRKDSWTNENDNVLAEICLRNIREGSTQLKAFEEAAKVLERTTSACSFRWNNVLRKTYKSELKKAKQERKANKLKKIKNQGLSTTEHKKRGRKRKEATTVMDLNTYKTEKATKVAQKNKEFISTSEICLISNEEAIRAMDLVMRFLHEQKVSVNSSNHQIDDEVQTLKDRISILEEENKQLKEEIKNANEDYGTIMAIMERGRQMVGKKGFEKYAQ